jgi:hypothetical protein
LTAVIEPFRESSIYHGQELIVESAVVRLKQYTTLIEKRKIKNTSIGTTRRKDKKVIINLPVAAEEWPRTSEGITKTISVELPGARRLAASIETEPLIKTHSLKLIMKVRTNTMSEKEAKEIRAESKSRLFSLEIYCSLSRIQTMSNILGVGNTVDIKITSPRPEHVKTMAPDTMAPPPYTIAESDDDDDASPPEFESISRTSSNASDSKGEGPWPADVKHPSGM